jgi:4-amino-4-deoxy-L-arabinose transferase-like glycosyltransferase
MKVLEFLEKQSVPKLLTGIFLFAQLLFLPNLGAVHLFDWDEINFAECAREILVSKDYLTVQVDFKPFWEKPPLFIWLQALSMKCFGVNEFAARLPNVLCGGFTLCLLFWIGNRINGKRFGLLWAMAYAGALLPHFYFHSGIIDPWFNFFIFTSLLGLYFFIFESKSYVHLLFSALAGGLAILTKGPAALIVIGGTSFFFSLFFSKNIFPFWKSLILWIILVLIVGGAWFVWLYLDGKEKVILDFIAYQQRLFQQGEAGHAQPWFYHPLVLLFGCFPLSILFIAQHSILWKQRDTWSKIPFEVLMFCFFWFPLVIFSLATTKIVHYSSLCYFSISYFAVRYTLYPNQKKQVFGINLGFGFIWVVALLAAPIAGMFIQNHYAEIVSLNWIKDPFALENLKADVAWSASDFIPGLFLLLALLISLFFLIKNKIYHSFLFTLIGVGCMLPLVLATFINKIEGITQGSVIGFYKGLKGKPIEIITVGYRSYAPYFYAEKQMEPKLDTLYMAKSPSKSELLSAHPQWVLVWEKNGFVAFKPN